MALFKLLFPARLTSVRRGYQNPHPPQADSGFGASISSKMTYNKFQKPNLNSFLAAIKKGELPTSVTVKKQLAAIDLTLNRFDNQGVVMS
jgi:hypothetical protein